MTEKLLLTPRDAAKTLSMGRTTVYELIRGGHLPARKVGSRLMVSVRDLEAWIAGLDQPYARSQSVSPPSTLSVPKG